jgi:hypothetical protein
VQGLQEVVVCAFRRRKAGHRTCPWELRGNAMVGSDLHEMRTKRCQKSRANKMYEWPRHAKASLYWWQSISIRRSSHPCWPCGQVNGTSSPINHSKPHLPLQSLLFDSAFPLLAVFTQASTLSRTHPIPLSSALRTVPKPCKRWVLKWRRARELGRPPKPASVETSSAQPFFAMLQLCESSLCAQYHR